MAERFRAKLGGTRVHVRGQAPSQAILPAPAFIWWDFVFRVSVHAFFLPPSNNVEVRPLLVVRVISRYA